MDPYGKAIKTVVDALKEADLDPNTEGMSEAEHGTLMQILSVVYVRDRSALGGWIPTALGGGSDGNWHKGNRGEMN